MQPAYNIWVRQGRNERVFPALSCIPRVRVFRNMNGNPAGILAFHSGIGIRYGARSQVPGAWDPVPDRRRGPDTGNRGLGPVPGGRGGRRSADFVEAFPNPSGGLDTQ